MKTTSLLTFALVSALLISCNSNKSKSFDHYGVYFNSKGSSVEIKGYQFDSRTDHFQGSDLNNTISIEMKSQNEPSQIWVYSKSINDEFILLTDLKNEEGEYSCCFNCGSYEKRPGDVCKSVDFVEKPSGKQEYRLFEATLASGQVYCFMNKTIRVGYIFRCN